MKTTYLTLFWGIFALFALSACNAGQQSKETQISPKTTASNNTEKSLSPTTSREDFSKMTLEERWKSLSPSRRNALRMDCSAYPYFKPMIAADPNMEEESAAQQNEPATIPMQAAIKPQPEKTPAEWWATFSTEFKDYLRKHPEEAGEFKPFLDQP